jgi:hypothetical protein
VAYPPGWVTTPQGEAAPGCAWFGSAPFTVVPNSDERPTSIAVKVEPVPLDTVSAPGPGQLARISTTVAERRAVRIEESATGDGLLPAGTAVVHSAVDAQGVVPAGGTLVLDLRGSPGADIRTLTLVLDRMAASVRLAGRQPRHLLVTRTPGGTNLDHQDEQPPISAAPSPDRRHSLCAIVSH